MSNNVKVYGSFHFAESCTFDPDRNLILAMNAANPRDMGSPPPLTPNDGFVSLINPDGSVHTSKWIGVARDGLTLVHPLGSAIQGGTLYVNDGNYIRTFDLKAGTPKQAFEVKEAVNLNGIGVAPDGTMYASNTGNATQPENKQRIYKVTPSGVSSVFVDGAPLALPNGVAIDPRRQHRRRQHRHEGRHHVQPGRPGRADRASGREAATTASSCSPTARSTSAACASAACRGSAAAKPAEVIATGIPSAASMCYDSKQNQLVIPLNPNNGLAFIPLGRR